MPRQTVLPVDTHGDSSFENYVSIGNRVLVEELKQLIAGERKIKVIYLWGEPGCGKTHLLNACCQEYSQFGPPPVYVSLGQQHGRLDQLQRIEPDVLVCIDDLQFIATMSESQVQILALYEKMSSGSGMVVVSGNALLSEIGLTLRDLESRLSSGGVYNVVAPSDSEKRKAVQVRARGRGVSLDDHVMDFIMSHYQRDTRSLFALLDRLDSASLEAQRKITIPFVKSLL